MNLTTDCRKPSDRRAAFVDFYLKLLGPWLKGLPASGSCAMWTAADEVPVEYPSAHPGDPKGGERKSVPVPKILRGASGGALEGLTRTMASLAAWTANSQNPDTISFPDGTRFRPKELIVSALVNGTNPEHPDFWLYAPTDRYDARQIEGSSIALTLWLARDWIFDFLTPAQVAQVATWLDSTTVFDDYHNNWKMFVALTEAAQFSLRSFGFQGDLERVIRLLNEIDAFAAGDGWLWDYPEQGIDYYNFWVNGSYHCFIAAILGDAMQSPILSGLDQRLHDLFRFFDARGRSVLMGRSLPYRWGMLTAPLTRLLLPDPPFQPADLHRLLLKNFDAWVGAGVLKPSGLLSERLTLDGCESGRECYMNAGQPYWCMQAFLPLAWGEDHPFWGEPNDLPASRPPEVVTRSKVGLIIQTLPEGREVRVYQTPNLSHVPVFHAIQTLYSKCLYSTAFGANTGGTRVDDLLDNELGVFWHDGRRLEFLMPVERRTERLTQEVRRTFTTQGGISVLVVSTLNVLSDGYQAEHKITIPGSIEEKPLFVEGGFPMVVNSEADAQSVVVEKLSGRADLMCGRTSSTVENGWEEIDSASFSNPTSENLIAHRSAFFRLRATLGPGEHSLCAQHCATYF